MCSVPPRRQSRQASGATTLSSPLLPFLRLDLRRRAIARGKEARPLRDQRLRDHCGVAHRLGWMAVAEGSLPAVRELHKFAIQIVCGPASACRQGLLLVPARSGSEP